MVSSLVGRYFLSFVAPEASALVAGDLSTTMSH